MFAVKQEFVDLVSKRFSWNQTSVMLEVKFLIKFTKKWKN